MISFVSLPVDDTLKFARQPKTCHLPDRGDHRLDGHGNDVFERLLRSLDARRARVRRAQEPTRGRSGPVNTAMRVQGLDYHHRDYVIESQIAIGVANNRRLIDAPLRRSRRAQ